ncbi:hypothetical protein PR202_ga20990 [Eleusine coracana subsp. coracana]|uniref:Uncharacterized protein n=1 Tax=Eleusine coracana subsp. coracana TaxID=191504 RepID=A0AAV5D0E8_ELECO|nr:hypothetical protein PR202_ga20990 [Eleusine coracana subsp. coracana]
MHGLSLRTVASLDVELLDECISHHNINSGYIVNMVHSNSPAERYGIDKDKSLGLDHDQLPVRSRCRSVRLRLLQCDHARTRHHDCCSVVEALKKEELGCSTGRRNLLAQFIRVSWKLHGATFRIWYHKVLTPGSLKKGPPTQCAPCRHPWVDCSLLSALVPPQESGYLSTKQLS